MSTTGTYKCHPSAAAGASRASSGGAAWSNSAYTDIIAAASSLANAVEITALCVMYSNNAAVDTTVEVELDLATGTAGAETVVATIPWTFRIDSALGHQPTLFFVFSAPPALPASTRLAVRVRQSLATTTITYNGIKILYLE